MKSSQQMMLGILSGVIFCIVASGQAQQLVTQDLTQGLTPTDLVNTLVGPGVTVTHVQFHGVDAAAGKVSGGTGIIGFANGIILSTGCIGNVIPQNGLNNFNDNTCDNQQPGDPDLDAQIPGFTTFDRCVLEFDFECQNLQVISFQYVFSSEEFNEYANTTYNDVFGFFVNGVNVALLPDNVTPVSINNVNCGNPVGDATTHNCSFFINNSCQGPPGYPDLPFPCTPPLQIEMDGLTVVLNVFIRTQSFTCTPVGTTGACCFPNGFCNDETSADCAEDGGVFHPDTDCKTFNCSATTCPGDTNTNGTVDIDDLVTVITHWGAGGGASDVNHDGTVNIDDLVIVITSWGSCP